jgi:shikimate kinase
LTVPRIFLVGPRASGKTTVGRHVADRLGWAFVDADEELERRVGRSVSDIFRNDGEPAFRDQESAVLADIASGTSVVIATGGGVVLRPGNRAILRTGFVARLAAPASVLWERMSSDPLTTARRPNLTTTGGVEEVSAVLAAREPLYADVADVTVDANLSPAYAAAVILTAWTAFAGRPSSSSPES